METKRELDGIGLAGVIVNIVMLGLECIGFLGLLISGLIIVWNDALGLLFILIALTLGSLAIITLIFNAKVLSGELNHKKVASVLGFICLSILGSVLLIISKDELNEQKNFDLADALTKFKELYDSQVISEEEYTSLKRKLIGD